MGQTRKSLGAKCWSAFIPAADVDTERVLGSYGPIADMETLSAILALHRISIALPLSKASARRSRLAGCGAVRILKYERSGSRSRIHVMEYAEDIARHLRMQAQPTLRQALRDGLDQADPRSPLW
jgi:hypothetical protein